MRNSKVSALCVIAAAALTACGGGGGSSGESHSPYTISLRADRTQLPLNIDNYPVGQGVYSPFSTTLYVEAKEGGRPIPGGKDIFSCNMASGLDSGSLYYLDGDPEHEVEVDGPDGEKIKVPGAYRSITLGSNSGGNSFHFHAKNRAGVARIVCAVTDPRDKKSYSTSVDISVGAATGHAATIVGVAQAPHYLGVKGNINNIESNVVVQVRVFDDANQPVANPSAPNVQVGIRSNSKYPAADGARLLGLNGYSGSSLQVATVGGIAQFSLSSGEASGPIILDFTTDRSDNNVSNGIQNAVASSLQINVVDALASVPLYLVGDDLGDLVNNQEFFYALAAVGGVPPYKWTVTGLPAGLSADDSGVISGTPKAAPGTYRVTIAVTDKNGSRASDSITLKLTGDQNQISEGDFKMNGCAGDINDACRIPDATVGSNYVYAFSASVPNVEWEFSGLPGWLSGGVAGVSGYIAGTPRPKKYSVDGQLSDPGNCGVSQFLVSAKKGAVAVTRKVEVHVVGESC